MFFNVIIDELLVPEWSLFALNEEDFEKEKEHTIHTKERFLPRILVDLGISKSINEIRRNRPDLIRDLNKFDFEEIKIGKTRIFIAVGASKEIVENKIKELEEYDN